jgi:hypothetical protein
VHYGTHKATKEPAIQFIGLSIKVYWNHAHLGHFQYSKNAIGRGILSQFREVLIGLLGKNSLMLQFSDLKRSIRKKITEWAS